MPRFMSPDTVRAVASSLKRLYDYQKAPFAVVLHGGEPLLAPAAVLVELLEALASNLPSSCARCIQTNGLLIDDAILDVCARTGTTLSVSLDGPKSVHDSFRVGFSHGGTFDAALAGINRIKLHAEASSLFTGVLCVIDPHSDPHEVYEFFKSIESPSIDFLFKDGNHSKLPQGKSRIDSTEYGSWLAAVWECYTKDRQPPRIRILDDLARLILGGDSTKEGCGQVSYGIAVIDTDGSITKNDTLKSIYDGADRFKTDWSIFTDELFDVASSHEFSQYLKVQSPTSEICKTCDLLKICGGGMPLTRWDDRNGLNNPSVYCSDHKLVIQRIQTSLFGLAASHAEID